MPPCRLLRLLLLLALAGLAASPARAVDPWVALEAGFRRPAMAQRRLTGPLFWLHGDETPKQIRDYVAKVAEGGNGSFTVESRPHTDWLGPGWYRDLAICLEAAKKHNLRMWIFDEKWWPSGEVGGKVPERYGSKRLITRVTDVRAGERVDIPVFQPDRRIGAVAARVLPGGLDLASLTELRAMPGTRRIVWNAPDGAWQVIQFAWEPRISGSRYLVDGASRDAVDWYLRTVYQPHYDRFGADFGKTIAGFFYDEPETHGDWGTEVMRVLAERKIDWKSALLAKTHKLAGAAQTTAAYQYQDAYAEAWGRTLYGGISAWCKRHRVVSIGHFLEHGNGYLNPDICAGNMMQLMKYTDMGGIDAVFDQFVWGKRVTRDNPIWQTPKLGSSISHAYGKPDDVAVVEIFGARGQDLTYPEMKWWTDHMFVSGLNFMIPHSFNVRAPFDTDCPPYFYNGGYEPRWPLYRVYADYASRLSSLLTGGKHVCPVALLYLGNSAHAGKVITPEQVSEALQDALYDCDWIPYDVLQSPAKVVGRELQLRSERYRVIVVPGVETLPATVLRKVLDFYLAGGIVLAHGFLPSRSADLGVPDTQVKALVRQVWGASALPSLKPATTNAAGGRAYLLPAAPTPKMLRQVLADAGVKPTLDVLSGDTRNWLHVVHRNKDGRDVFYVANQNHKGKATRFKFAVTAPGVPEVWDPIRAEVNSAPFRRQGDRVTLDLTMEPLESRLLVFAPSARPLPRRLEPGVAPIRTVAVPGKVVVKPRSAPRGPGGSVGETLKNSQWIWAAGGSPASSAKPGPCTFSTIMDVPAGRIRSAIFVGTADNSFRLIINGKPAGQGGDSGEGWRSPARLDVASALQSGPTLVQVEAVNATDKPSPAGLVGVLTIDVEGARPVILRTDSSWRAAAVALDPEAGPAQANDWPYAVVAAPFGGGPWGSLGGGLTLSPARAAPFMGSVALQSAPTGAVYLEMVGVAPEQAARVTINGCDAGGVIGAPLRLEVGRLLRKGANQVRIEPFGPTGVRLAWY